MLIITKEEASVLLGQADFVLRDLTLYKPITHSTFEEVATPRTRMSIPKGSRFYRENEHSNELLICYDDEQRKEWGGVKSMSLTLLKIIRL